MKIVRHFAALFQVVGKTFDHVIVVTDELRMNFVDESFEVFGVTRRAQLRRVRRAERGVVREKVDVGELAGSVFFHSGHGLGQRGKIRRPRFIRDEVTHDVAAAEAPRHRCWLSYAGGRFRHRKAFFQS